jgi:hypothetical protein
MDTRMSHNARRRDWHGCRRWPGARCRGAVAALVLAVAGAGLTVGTVAGTAVPASAGPVPRVTAGGGHSCALMTDQTV